jgi:large conductance mechanosensitive channel
VNTIIEFLIVAFVVFLLVRQVNKWLPAPAPAEPRRDCPFCASSIPVRARKCPFCTADLSGAGA